MQRHAGLETLDAAWGAVGAVSDDGRAVGLDGALSVNGLNGEGVGTVREGVDDGSVDVAAGTEGGEGVVHVCGCMLVSGYCECGEPRHDGGEI